MNGPAPGWNTPQLSVAIRKKEVGNFMVNVLDILNEKSKLKKCKLYGHMPLCACMLCIFLFMHAKFMEGYIGQQ